MQGEGMARGALPLGDVRVALCVPRSCSEAALQAALRTALRAAPGHNTRSVRVAVMPGSCQDGQGDHVHHGDEGSSLFWYLHSDHPTKSRERIGDTFLCRRAQCRCATVARKGKSL